MSQENVKIVRRGYEALVRCFEQGDFERGDFDAAGFEWLDPEIDWRGPEGFPDLAEFALRIRGSARLLPRSDRGHRGLPDEPRGVHRRGGDQVLVFSREGGRGRGSGAAVVTQPTAHLWTLRNGKAIRLRSYWERSDALEAAGLRE